MNAALRQTILGQQVDFKVLNEEIGKGSQDVVYTETLLHKDGHKCRLSIRSDSYAFQSHARADIWSPTDLRWNRAIDIHYSKMCTEKGLYYQRLATSKVNFAQDRAELMRQLSDLLA